MPVYCFKCEVDKVKDEVVRTIAERNDPLPCPICSLPMVRDIHAEAVHSPDQGYWRPLYSDAAGVHPSQVEEAKRRFPDHEFHPDGRMVFRSHGQRKRQLKELGFHDRDSY